MYHVVIPLEYTYVINLITNNYFHTQNQWFKYDSGPSVIDIIDNVQAIHREADKLNESIDGSVNVVEGLSSQEYVVTISSTNQSFVNNARTKILQKYNRVGYKQVELEASSFRKLNHDFFFYLNDLASRYDVDIIISDENTDFQTKVNRSNHPYVYVLGFEDNITVAESQLRILLDTMMDEYHLDYVNIDLSVVPLIGGIDLYNFNQIAMQLKANIYILDLLPSLFSTKVLDTTSQLKISITARNVHEIALSKHILTRLLEQLKSNGKWDLFVKLVTLPKTTIDALVLHNQPELLNIMFKYGVYVQVPSLAEPGEYDIIIQGQTAEMVNDAVEDLALLGSRYYTLTLRPAGFPNDIVNKLLKLVSNKRSCVVTASSHCIELTGLAEDIKAALSDFNTDYVYWHSCFSGDFDIKLQIELNNSQKDFISGKKNGKLIKILNQLHLIPQIQFKPFNQNNFYIDISITSGNPTTLPQLLQAIHLVECELPAEDQFNIPEVFHKSIIGNGGSIIQSIMKKYNVFIKFSNKNNLNESRVFYTYKRSNNVLIKCPRKNSRNIMLARYEIDQLVQLCLKNQAMIPGLAHYRTTGFKLLKGHYMLMINAKNKNLNFVNELEIKHGVYIDFPKSVEAFQNSNELTVSIRGSDHRSQQCAEQLRLQMPINYEIKVTFSPGKFDHMISEANVEFCERVLVPLNVRHDVTLTINETPIGTYDTGFHQVILSSYLDASIKAGVQQLTSFLREKEFMIADRSPWKYEQIVDTEVEQLRPINNVVRPVAKFEKNAVNYNFTNDQPGMIRYRNQYANILIP